MICLLAALAIAQTSHPFIGIHGVKVTLSSMEESAGREIFIPDQLSQLPREDADAILSCLPAVRRPQVVGAISLWMANHSIDRAIPALIKTFNRTYPPSFSNATPPAFQGLARFGANAKQWLIQAVRNGTHQERYWSAQLLVTVATYSWGDKRIEKLFTQLAQDPDSELRKVAANGNWNLSLRSHIWGMDGIYYYDVVNLDLFRPVLDLACDQDRGVSEHAVRMLRHLIWTVDRSAGDPEGNGEAIHDLRLDQIQPNLEKLLKSKQPEMRAAAVMLENYNNGLDRVRYEALSDPDPLVVHSAIVSSEVAIPKEWLPSLIKLTKAENPQIRRAAATLLRATQDPIAQPTLERLSKDPDSEVRAVAQQQ